MTQHIQMRTRKLYAAVVLLTATLLISIGTFAQDKKVDVNITTKSDSNSNFFMQPGVWIVAGAVFILLLVALLRGNKSKD